MTTLITANRLGDGVVVFLDAQGAWSEDFHRAAILEGKDAEAAALARAKGTETANEVVEPYVVELESRGGHFTPKALRETIRACGPTVRRDLGKQAHGQAPSLVQRASEFPHVSL